MRGEVMDVMLGGIPNLILLPVPGVHPALKESSAFFRAFQLSSEVGVERNQVLDAGKPLSGCIYIISTTRHKRPVGPMVRRLTTIGCPQSSNQEILGSSPRLVTFFLCFFFLVLFPSSFGKPFLGFFFSCFVSQFSSLHFPAD